MNRPTKMIAQFHLKPAKDQIPRRIVRVGFDQQVDITPRPKAFSQDGPKDPYPTHSGAAAQLPELR